MQECLSFQSQWEREIHEDAFGQQKLLAVALGLYVLLNSSLLVLSMILTGAEIKYKIY